MSLKRLQAIISASGHASRRAAEKLIQAGQVRVNGRVVTALGTKADSSKDQIEVEGTLLTSVPAAFRYFIFHKPFGVTTTLSDPHAKKTIADFFGNEPVRLYPAGRLDQNSTGLLLVTNDGELVNHLTHPRFGVKKYYQVVISRALTAAELRQIQEGIMLDDQKTAPCRVRLLNQKIKKGVIIEIILHEGRKRQIRRMMRQIGIRVLKLHRIGYGPLRLGRLAPGEKRALSDSETKALKAVIHDKTN
ncbi:MAG: pseudouridine synthase [Candidatus Omnitrophica bacterium CG11_big_fil_rev_8_21_14_0_20_45_26]|uniref:Pseudouridine synthase n=1 Tax=Candidatus Abzuiibacterium crystallinum TaxID=1974748 RepID=A0A2H0LLN6_9BACT|nr:MAG: pseudouridine synthase [Candidatus Omnitrophica bacterium CG11_big_fil_rev_8_21_14_0_20_45_26]PIW65773.1 MAG: pseudouridine synthase [Candidatus Omnitrophica bacterium CG12_big_fil_rev_8_21_14_0_65_45_16]